MPRGSRRATRAAAALRALQHDDGSAPPLGGGERVEAGYRVRPVTGTKTYRCPGCDQEIAAGLPHLVAWPDGRPDDRRHWHTGCWSARERRGPRLLRGRGAPRY